MTAYPRALTAVRLADIRAGSWAAPDVLDLVDEVERLRTQVAATEAALAKGELSDGYHTHAELYLHRLYLTAHAAQGWLRRGVPVVKSWRHHTEEACLGGGWFIVVADLATGPISYHYPAWAWRLFAVPAQERAPVWDGHTPDDVIERLDTALIPDKESG